MFRELIERQKYQNYFFLQILENPVLVTARGNRSKNKPDRPSYQVDEASEAVLPVEEFQHSSVGEGNGEEHGGVAAARGVGTLQQPQSVAHHVR